MEQVVVDVFCVRGVCGRAGVRVWTWHFAFFFTVPVDAEARPRAPTVADK